MNYKLQITTRPIDPLAHKNVFIYHKDYPNTLQESELNDPMRVIVEFFSTYKLPAVKRDLTLLTKHQLASTVITPVSQRARLYRFMFDLERLADASWMLNQYHLETTERGQEDLPKEYLDIIQDENIICFSNLSESLNPIRGIRYFFRNTTLRRWKNNYLLKLRKSITNPDEDLFFDYSDLDSLAYYIDLIKALESLFLLLLRDGKLPDYKEHLVQKSTSIPSKSELRKKIKSKDISVYLRDYENMIYGHRFINEWTRYNTLNIFESYENLLKFMRNALQLLSYYSTKKPNTHIDRVAMQYKSWTFQKTTAYFNNLLVTSPAIRRIPSFWPEQQEIDKFIQFIFLAYRL